MKNGFYQKCCEKGGLIALVAGGIATILGVLRIFVNLGSFNAISLFLMILCVALGLYFGLIAYADRKKQKKENGLPGVLSIILGVIGACLIVVSIVLNATEIERFDKALANMSNSSPRKGFEVVYKMDEWKSYMDSIGQDKFIKKNKDRDVFKRYEKALDVMPDDIVKDRLSSILEFLDNAPSMTTGASGEDTAPRTVEYKDYDVRSTEMEQILTGGHFLYP